MFCCCFVDLLFASLGFVVCVVLCFAWFHVLANDLWVGFGALFGCLASLVCCFATVLFRGVSATGYLLWVCLAFALCLLLFTFCLVCFICVWFGCLLVIVYCVYVCFLLLFCCCCLWSLLFSLLFSFYCCFAVLDLFVRFCWFGVDGCGLTYYARVWCLPWCCLFVFTDYSCWSLLFCLFCLFWFCLLFFWLWFVYCWFACLACFCWVFVSLFGLL